jgi:hypothetical protein
MRRMKLLGTGAAAIALAGVAMAAHATTTISNTPSGASQSKFGADDTQTYGQVFTAPEGGKLTSFTMYLDGAIGGQLYGGVGEWNGTEDFDYGFGVSSTLFESAPVAANHAGGYTFKPNVGIVAGHLYVAYLSVFGLDHAGQGVTSAPLSVDDDGLPGDYFNYFVFNNDNGQGHGPHDSSWNYFLHTGDNLRLDATFNGAVPEPATWAMMILGFGLAGATLRRRRAATA